MIYRFSIMSPCPVLAFVFRFARLFPALSFYIGYIQFPFTVDSFPLAWYYIYIVFRTIRLLQMVARSRPL